mmetsp:Transcript_13321/g.18160  ORF Transcript_13321/g.18160 Transcript_13321/m.18160 type:complete len:216 (+) Transcript_13321:107-754(+)
MDLMSGGKMSGRVQLDAWHGTLLNCYGSFFLTILSFDDSDVGVDQRVVLLFEIMTNLGELAQDLSLGRLLLLLQDELLELAIEHIRLDIVVVESLKGVVVHREASDLLQDVELPLHLLNFILLEVKLHGLVTQLDQHIIEHDILLIVISGDRQGDDLSVAEALIALHALLEWNERAALRWISLCQLLQELVQVAHSDVASGVVIVLRPDALEVLD